MDEAERRYLTEIAEDCRAVLGPGTTLLEIERDEVAEGVRLVVRFELDEEEWECATVGDTVVDAHALLRAKILFDRLRIGFTSLVESR